jgi:hypothetical protein
MCEYIELGQSDVHSLDCLSGHLKNSLEGLSASVRETYCLSSRERSRSGSLNPVSGIPDGDHTRCTSAIGMECDG